MNGLKQIVFLFVLVLTLSFLTPSENAWAQNFGNIVSSEEKSEEELLIEEELKVLLNQKQEAFSDTPLGTEVSSQYTLGVDDVINISVLRHPEVSNDYLINRDGKIQYEFVGDITIEGLTKEDVNDLLTEKLSKFIISPEVTVKIVGYNSKVVYVVGEVARPGKIFMRGDTITIREALVQAGLPLLSAKSAKSRLITPSDSGNPELINVNVHKLIYEGDLRENFVMEPGDTLYIPATVMAKALRVIQPVAAPISTGAGTARKVTTGF